MFANLDFEVSTLIWKRWNNRSGVFKPCKFMRVDFLRSRDEARAAGLVCSSLSVSLYFVLCLFSSSPLLSLSFFLSFFHSFILSIFSSFLLKWFLSSSHPFLILSCLYACFILLFLLSSLFFSFYSLVSFLFHSYLVYFLSRLLSFFNSCWSFHLNVNVFIFLSIFAVCLPECWCHSR
jgi:hypothetical protein